MSDTRDPIRRARARAADYLELGKARLCLFVLGTTLVGFLMAPQGGGASGLLLPTMIGTCLTASGSLALNQWMERERDARMVRTRNRPIPRGVFSASRALGLSVAAVAIGLAILLLAVNPLTAGLALAVVVIYLLAYTPMKPRNPACTLVGALCGALPPMMGWSAATGSIGPGAWILAATLFLWQIPHFLALAWLYREDFERGGFRMLPAIDHTGGLTGWMAVLYASALVPIGAVGTLVGLAGFTFLIGSLLLGTGFLSLGILLLRDRTLARARTLFLGSLIYLPLLLGLMVADRGRWIGP